MHALVTDSNPAHFRWNPQFLELCGHYRLQPRACRPYRARTKGKIERPFFYLEEQFLKGRSFGSLLDLHYQLARFEEDDLDVYVHATTQERAIDRFQGELPHLTPLPEQRFVSARSAVRPPMPPPIIAMRTARCTTMLLPIDGTAGAYSLWSPRCACTASGRNKDRINSTSAR
jgi:hypothetical protein